MKNFTAIFKATCYVLNKEQYQYSHTVDKGLRPNLMLENNFCPSTIYDCDKPIPPGKHGELKIRAIILEEDKKNVKEGFQFEIKEGPLNTLAKCQIIEVIGFED